MSKNLFNPKMIASLAILGFVIFLFYFASTGGFSELGASISQWGKSEAKVGVVSAAALERCYYTSGTGLTGNTTIRADPNGDKNVYLDIDGTEYITYSAVAGNNLNVTFTCVRAGSAQEAESYLIVVKGDKFGSEVSTSSTSLYNILETSSTKTNWFNDFKQTIYVAGDTTAPTYATTSDTQEFGYLNFAAGAKTATLGVLGEIDATSLAALNNYTTKEVRIYQRVEGVDTELGKVIINKLP